jgi:hypothetical protein
MSGASKRPTVSAVFFKSPENVFLPFLGIFHFSSFPKLYESNNKRNQQEKLIFIFFFFFLAAEVPLRAARRSSLQTARRTGITAPQRVHWPTRVRISVQKR